MKIFELPLVKFFGLGNLEGSKPRSGNCLLSFLSEGITFTNEGQLPSKHE